MRKVLLGLLLGGLFMLLLSALVVTPQQAVGTEPPAEALPAQVQAVLMPAPVAPTNGADAAPVRSQTARAFYLLALAAVCLLPAFHSHDANGRVLTAKRYENSVYQVFRAEVAGG